MVSPLVDAFDPAGVEAGDALPPGADDPRNLPVRYASTGVRHREFRSALELMSQDEYAVFAIRGGRTCKWVLDFMLEKEERRGAGTAAGRQTCASVPRTGVAPHEAACLILEAMCSHDQLNCANLAAAEHAARQVQLTEERWKERATGSVDAHEQHLEFHVFAGTSTRSHLCICPEFAEWISDELRRESAINKERCKAREERALARSSSGRGRGRGGECKDKDGHDE